MGNSGRSRSGYRVLIAGGGVAALEATLALRELAEERVQVELLAAEPDFWYRPLAVAEPFGVGQPSRLSLVDFARECDAQVTLGALAAVNADNHVAVTRTGGGVSYDALLIACGTEPHVAVPGALTFRGPADVPAFARLLEAVGRHVRRLTFALPTGTAWTLPAYELALLTAAYLQGLRLRTVELRLVTPEQQPLGLFGNEASEEIARLLDDRGIALSTHVEAVAFAAGKLELVSGEGIETDAVVALPRLEGVRVSGVPRDPDGFIDADRFGRVPELIDVFAAGDVTSFPVKQGGLAAQQADAAASTIAVAAGAPVEPTPFEPVLRGLLLTGGIPRYLRAELDNPANTETDALSLWWPPSKITGRYLAPFLAAHYGDLLSAPPGVQAMPIEIGLAGEYRPL
jgi:sulfide:quinone oxidoreductase